MSRVTDVTWITGPRHGKTAEALRWAAARQDEGAPLVLFVVPDEQRAQALADRIAAEVAQCDEDRSLDPSRVLVISVAEARHGGLRGRPTGTAVVLGAWEDFYPTEHRVGILGEARYLGGSTLVTETD